MAGSSKKAELEDVNRRFRAAQRALERGDPLELDSLGNAPVVSQGEIGVGSLVARQRVRFVGRDKEYLIISIKGNRIEILGPDREIKEVTNHDIEPVLCAACGSRVGPDFLVDDLLPYPGTDEKTCSPCYSAAQTVGFKEYYMNRHWTALRHRRNWKEDNAGDKAVD